MCTWTLNTRIQLHVSPRYSKLRLQLLPPKLLVMMHRWSISKMSQFLEFGNNEFYWKTIELTGYRLKNVEECRTFPYAMERIEKYVEESRRQYKCKEVVLFGWNLYSVDHRILVHDYNCHNRDWPDSWRWVRDGYRSVFANQHNRFKIKSRTNNPPDGAAAKAGNTSMSVAGIYDAFTRRSMKNHHKAKDDVNATIQILRESDVWKLRKQGLQNKNGWYLLQDRVEDCLKSLKEYRDQLYPPLPCGWKENPEDPAPTERIKHTVEPV